MKGTEVPNPWRISACNCTCVLSRLSIVIEKIQCTENSSRLCRPAASLPKFVIALRKAKNIDHSQIINMDQTMCRFDMPPKRTNIKKGDKTVGIKTHTSEKERVYSAIGSNGKWNQTPRDYHLQRAWWSPRRVSSAVSLFAFQCKSE